jgi:hypothetical protein
VSGSRFHRAHGLSSDRSRAGQAGFHHHVVKRCRPSAGAGRLCASTRASGQRAACAGTCPSADDGPSGRRRSQLGLPQPRRRRDQDGRLGRRRAPERQHKAPDARIPRGEPVVVDQVLPDGHRVPTAPERLADQLSIRLAGAGTRRTTRASDPSEVRRTPLPWWSV